MLSFGPFRLIGAERLLLKDGAAVAIGGRALDILIAMTERAGEVVSVRELIELVWPDVFVEEANLRVHISALRKVLGDGKEGSRYIVNVAGRGYTFVAPIQRDAAEPGFPIATSAVRPRNLPSLPPFLVGRADTIDTLSTLLLSRRFVSVVGPGGIGKTTVAVAVAHALREEFGEDSVCFVDLGSLTDPASVANAVASALGCAVQGLDPAPYIRAFLVGKRILVVLDSCEHVVEAVAPLCESLLRAAPSLHLLTTSREVLRAEAENVHLLMPLDTPPEDAPSAAQALASPAVRLFMERAASSGYHTELSDADAAIVTKICQRLDGIALSIELVASRVGAYGIRGTANLLDSGAELFLQGRRSALPRHQTLQAMLDWSFKLLSPDEQRILCRLSVFVGPFTLAAATAVASDRDDDAVLVTNAVASLVDKSLIWISSSGAAYYRLLDTTRAYAAARLVECGETEMVARQHARFFIDFLEAAAPEGSTFDSRNLAACAAQMGNVRKALEWAFSASGDIAMGVDLTARAAPLFLAISLFAECLEWCRRGLGALPEGDRGTRRELELQKALAMSSMYVWVSSEETKTAIERGLELSEALHDQRHQLYLLAGLNIYLTRRGDFVGALDAAKRSAAVAETSGGAAEKIMTQWMAGTAHHLVGDQAGALLHSELGFKLASEIAPVQLNFFGYDHNVRGLAALARTLWLRGFPDQALKVAHQGIDGVEGFNHPVSYCIVLLYMVPVFQWRGDFKGAAEIAERAIAHATKYSLVAHQAVGLALRGEIMVSKGDAPEGVKLLSEALDAMDANHYHIVSLPTARALAEGLAVSGRPAEALVTINEAVAKAEKVGETLWPPDLLRTQGEILLAQPRPDFRAAEDSMLRSIDYARRQSALSWELKAAMPLARLWNEQGRLGDARAMLKAIYRQFTEGFETKDLQAARRLLDELDANG